jgi:hypothetical protein
VFRVVIRVAFGVVIRAVVLVRCKKLLFGLLEVVSWQGLCGKVHFLMGIC